MNNIICFVTLVALSFATPARGDLVFNITSTGNANADAGFQRAADFWSETFDDDVTINITAGFASLGSGILGQAGSVQGTLSYDVFRTGLANDATSVDDDTFRNSLSNGSNFSVLINHTSNNPNASQATGYVDSTGDNTNKVRMTKANAKALGVTPNDAIEDASITFSSDFAFDFDPSDGIGAGLIDFVGVAIHELGHAMGFTSGVDVLDGNADGFPDDSFEFVSPVDFLRHSVESVNAGADLDWRAGAEPKFYSIDGGITVGVPGTDHWSTGVNLGDGRQASHWKDNLGLGILDPTSAPAGSLNVVTPLDIQALDVVGWNVIAVPEPGGMLSLLIACGCVGLRRRRRAISELS